MLVGTPKIGDETLKLISNPPVSLNQFMVSRYNRFRKSGIDVQVERITKDDIYPKLPKHNLCIATEVMEHVFEPLTLYQNINEALDTGGILHGNFGDHEPGLFHVTPVLKDLRERVLKDFNQLDPLTYQKK